MTLSMFIRILYNYLRSQDMEECRELYEEMLQTTREEGWETVELTSWETRLLGTVYVRTTLREHGLKVGGYPGTTSKERGKDEAGKETGVSGYLRQNHCRG